jgi:hypothetical protein
MPAGSTYTPLATTSPSGASSIDFTSISGSYTDLVLVGSLSVGGTSGGTMKFQVNGDTGTNYSYTTIAGDGTTASSGRVSTTDYGLAIGLFGGVSNASPATLLMNFQNYSNATTFKTVLARGNSAGAVVDAQVSLWRSTSAITSIKIFMSGSRTLSGTCTLYGIASA